MGNRTSDIKEQQCQADSCSAGEYNKCRGVEETTECLQGGEQQIEEKSKGQIQCIILKLFFASHICDQDLIPALTVSCGLSFSLVLALLGGFFSWLTSFSPSTKTDTSKF